jgi:hypothetical protein
MAISRRAKLYMLLAALSVGTALQVGTNGCAEYYVAGALGAVDLCKVFNCEGGTFFNFCTPVKLLVDCPTVATGP